MAAKDVLLKAKKEGSSLSLAQVYTARSTANKAAGKPSSTRPRAPLPSHERNAVPTSVAGLQTEFRQLAMRFGTDHS